jgi:hypothetical protein
MTNQINSRSQRLVLEAIVASPNITIMQITKKTGLSRTTVRTVVVELSGSGHVHAVLLPRENGMGGDQSRGFSVDPNYKQEAPPKTWDVLAHFFGRIAEPAAA